MSPAGIAGSDAVKQEACIFVGFIFDRRQLSLPMSDNQEFPGFKPVAAIAFCRGAVGIVPRSEVMQLATDLSWPTAW
jgi:hypothetical protein